MLKDLKDVQEIELPKANVCILGGGVAGLVLANELKDTFDNIVLLEAGTEEFELTSQDNYTAQKYPNYFPDPNYSRLRYLGGSSNHWENSTSPLSEIDFEKRSWVKNSGWPINFQELEPYYVKAADYCGTGTEGYNTELWAEKFDQVDILENSTVLSTGIVKAAVPPTRFFEKLKDRLISSNRITIYKNANVVDIDFDSETQKIQQVFIESTPSDKKSIKADIVIMCFGGIENARFLLEFNNKYNNNLGNQNDCVGRYFMDHPIVKAAHLFVDEENKHPLYSWQNFDSHIVKGFFQLNNNFLKKHKLNNLRIPLNSQTNYIISDGISSLHSISNSIAQTEFPDNFGTHIYNMLSDIDMVIEAISRKSFDQRIFDHANQFGGYELQIMTEQTPEHHNRIKLSNQKDKFGIHKIIVDWQLSDNDKAQLWKTLEAVATELGALSIGRLQLLKEREDQLWSSQLSFGNHHMGTTRMADSVQNGVVDANQKVFGTTNFYIAGSSVFPTGGHVPPTLTITALTIKLAEHLKELNKNEFES